MDKLFRYYHDALRKTDVSFVRYLHDRINWDAELNAILGSRGVGKTTLMLQHIKLSKTERESLYIAADSPYFAAHKIIDIAEQFYRKGGKHLYIDEVHRYPGWSREVKFIHDTFDGLQVTLSGSSMIDLIHGLEVDLSRRAVPYKLTELSFREYLMLAHKLNVPTYTLDEVLEGKVNILDTVQHPLQAFDEYLRHGAYPFFRKGDYETRLNGVVSQTLDIDIPHQTNISVSTTQKLKKLMYVIAQSTPFKPNVSNLGRTLELDRRTVADMLVYMEKAGLLRLLREGDDIMDQFTKIEKVYLSNTNLSYAMCDEQPDVGTLRETFFFSQMATAHRVSASPVSDFLVDAHTFEVGGRNKKRKQIAGVSDAYVVKDDVECVFENNIPLWMFGLTY